MVIKDDNCHNQCPHHHYSSDEVISDSDDDKGRKEKFNSVWLLACFYQFVMQRLFNAGCVNYRGT